MASTPASNSTSTLASVTDSTSVSVLASVSTTRPFFVIVPGASQTPSHYAYLIHLLQSRGYGTLTALLPSCGTTRPVSAEEDAEFIRSRLLLPILDTEKQDVILVMHSYGGLPGSAAARGLGKVDRVADGKTTSVLGQIFIATILPRGGDGADVIATLGGHWPPFINIHEAEGRMKCDQPKVPLYADVASPLDEGAELSSISQSLMCFTSPCPLTSWHSEAFHGRCAYVRCLHDKAISYDIQCAMLEHTEQEWIVRDIATGHSPQLAAPETLRDIILEVGSKLTGERLCVTNLLHAAAKM
ncbi:hypothetical protein G7Y89_g12116 [Cudoniella acicularis]|uniref:AB hydrolase-1 domain-containing protein n=1 Tax=Cudoniella acicularis TaxID=354080 RepID=A0A8H4R9M8_9HELO|nr:hypothetical protein G7Y89_g12116 [Cudoniella acicularis]